MKRKARGVNEQCADVQCADVHRAGCAEADYPARKQSPADNQALSKLREGSLVVL